MSERETAHWGGDRGQLVLVAALALALALVALGVAYLQLGYHDDVAGPEPDPSQDLEAALDRALHDATADVPETYHWDDRESAAQAVRTDVQTTTDRLETNRLQDGHAYHVQVNETATAQWLAANCPSGPDRQFGDCEVVDGIAVQERNDRTHVLAVSFDITATTPEGETSVTVALERRPT